MIASLKKTPTKQFPRAKITHAVKSVLPKGNFQLRVTTSKLGEMKIVRVITPAWKSLRPAARIEKILDAVNGKLTTQERNGILRFSVLTPDEFEELVLNSPAAEKSPARHLKAKRSPRRKE